MMAIESGNDPTKEEYRQMNFGYPRIKSSEENDPNGLFIEKLKQRNCTSYFPISSVALSCLNIYPEINCITDELEYTVSRNRKRRTKISLIQCYRNHSITVPVFTGWINNLIKMNRKIGIDEFVVFGDMNSSSINLNELIEIPHIGFHKHREKSKARLIDKIFISQKLLDIGLEVQVLNSVETIASETNGLGHKSFIIAINEEITNKEANTIVSMRKFNKKIKRKFTDHFTNRILLADIGKTPLQPVPYISRSDFSKISAEEYASRFRDPAALLTDVLVEILNESKVQVKNRDPFSFEKIHEAAVGRTSDAVKRFSRMTKYVLDSICTTNPLLTHSIDGEEKPELNELCICLSKKLNKCHRGDEDFLAEFAESKSINILATPEKLSMAELNKALKNVKPKKTPWIRGISPAHVLQAAKISGNFKKVLLTILNRCLVEGKLATCMNHDSVVFLFKKGSRSDSSNYRPISIDHPFTKILCEILNQKAIRKLDIYRHPLNFSYIANKSTMSAILTASLLTEEIVKRGNVPLIICTDMSGAFETCQSLLISKCLDRMISNDSEIKIKETVVNYMTEKVIFGKEKDNSLIEVFREDKMIGAGQGSKASPNLFLIQASSALYGLNRRKRTFLIQINGVEMFLLVYADDNFTIIELIPIHIQTGDERLPIVRKIIKSFMQIWEFEVSRSGMLINKTKTEVLVPNCPSDEKIYPPIKQSIKWLGMNLKMNKNGVLVGDTEKNLKMIKSKTWSKFQQLSLLTTKIEIKLRTFTMFLEPVINYCLLDAVTNGIRKYDKVINQYQVIQNNFLRTIACVGSYSKIDELHRILNIKMVKDKVENAAENEWQKVDLVKNFSPQRRRSRSGEVPIIDSVKSLFWNAANSAELNTSNRNDIRQRFDLDKFNVWKKEQDEKRRKIMASRNK